MAEGILEKDMISRPELWRLVLMVSGNSLHVALYPPVAREEIIWRKFSFDPSTPGRLRAIEDIIYGNPLLLCDFKRVDCIIDSTDYLILPPDTPENDRPVLMESVGLDADEESVIESCPAENAMFVQSLDREIVPFLRRTFFNVSFVAKMSLLISYFGDHDANFTARRAYALVDDSHLSFLAFDGPRLLAANEFSYRRPTDAAYYVLASMKQLGFDPSDPEVTLSTHRTLSDDNTTIQSLLKPYVRSLRTVPFPTLRYRASRSTLLIPFPLIVLPICE